jgi:hypothetical protein
MRQEPGQSIAAGDACKPSIPQNGLHSLDKHYDIGNNKVPGCGRGGEQLLALEQTAQQVQSIPKKPLSKKPHRQSIRALIPPIVQELHDAQHTTA